MYRTSPFENRILSIAIPDRDVSEYERQRNVQERPRRGVAWFIPNSPPLPNDNYNHRRYRRGIERQPDIEMMLMDHQEQARRGQRRATVDPHPMNISRDNDRARVRIRVRNPGAPEEVHSNNGIRLPRWSLFQVWNNLAYVTCSVPSKVVWDDQEGKFFLKYSRLQQVICGGQHILITIEMIFRKRLFAVAFLGAANPLKYLRFGQLVVEIVVGLAFTTTAFIGMDNLLELHMYAVNSGNPVGYQIQMGTAITLATFAGFLMVLFTYSTMEVGFYTYHDQGSWDSGPAELIQTFACYARQVFTWATEQDCPDDIFLSLKMLPKMEILYGGLGLVTYISKVFVQMHTTLMIASSCWTILGASCQLSKEDTNQLEQQRQDHQPLSLRYEFLTQLSNKISSYIGFIFLLVLGVMAVSLPNSLDEIFNYHELSSLVESLPSVITLISSTAACISAMQIDALEDKLTENENVEQLPNDIRRLIIYLHRLFRRSVGIGYRGLFVMNFVCLFTYCGTVASLVAFTYETKKSQ